MKNLSKEAWNKCDPQFYTPFAIRQTFSTIFKEPDVLPQWPWQNKHLCFLKHSVVMIWRLCLDRISSGKNILVRFSSFSCDSRIFFVPFLSRETNLSASFIQMSMTRAPGLVILAAIQRTYVCDSYPGSGCTGSNLENIWLELEILQPLQVLKPASTKTQMISWKKIIRSSVAIGARFFYIFFLEWDGFVIDMNHSVNFWSMDFSLMRPQLKIWQIFEFALSVTQR